MKRTILLGALAAVCAGLSFISCKKETAPSQPSTPSSNPYAIIHNQFAKLAGGEDMAVESFADFTRSKMGTFSGDFNITALQDGVGCNGIFKVNQYAVPLDGDIFFASSSKDTSNLRPLTESTFGATNTISLTGSTSFPDFSVQHYFPKLVSINLLDYGTLSQSNTLNIGWQVDGQNGNNPVVVVVHYDPAFPGNEDIAVAHPSPIAKMFTFTEANGTGSIPASELAAFPLNARINLYVARGNEVIQTVSGKTIRLLAVATTTVAGMKLSS